MKRQRGPGNLSRCRHIHRDQGRQQLTRPVAAASRTATTFTLHGRPRRRHGVDVDDPERRRRDHATSPVNMPDGNMTADGAADTKTSTVDS